MAETTFPTNNLPSAPSTARSQRVAWAVMLIAFGVFCALCVVSGIGVNFFLFQSRVPMPAELVVGRGTVGLTGTDLIETVVRSSRELFNSAVISTDGQSQATLSFIDPQRDRRLVASVTVKRNTMLDLETVSRPRFDLSSEHYDVQIEDLAGSLDVFIPSGLDRTIRVSVRTPQGVWVLLSASGQYSIRASETDVIVNNVNGEALVVAPDQVGTSVQPGERGVITYGVDDDSSTFVSVPAYTDLIINSSFEQTNAAITTDTDPRELPLSWGCADQVNEPPGGYYGISRVDGRVVMQLRRGGGASSHGETFCVQSFGPPGTPGRDVTAYSYLSLRATFRIQGQSLSTCGIAGSECPLMMQITYIDIYGRQQQWYHGFYVYSNPSLGYPLSCDSCRQEHEPINANTWYTYESDNLYSLISSLERPQSIQEVRFYASGHEYDVTVSSVSLLAGISEFTAVAQAVGR